MGRDSRSEEGAGDQGQDDADSLFGGELLVEKRDADENGDDRIESRESYNGRGTSLFEGREKGEEADEGEEPSERRPREASGVPLDFKFLHKQNDDREGQHSDGLKQERLTGLAVV